MIGNRGLVSGGSARRTCTRKMHETVTVVTKYFGWVEADSWLREFLQYLDPVTRQAWNLTNATRHLLYRLDQREAYLYTRASYQPHERRVASRRELLPKPLLGLLGRAIRGKRSMGIPYFTHAGRDFSTLLLAQPFRRQVFCSSCDKCKG